MRHLVRSTRGFLTVLIILTGLFLWGCGGGGGGGGGGGSELPTDSIDTALPSESGSLQADQWLHRKIDVPAGTAQLQVDLTVPRGKVELLLKNGQQPDEQMYYADGEDCYNWADPVYDGQCIIDSPTPGTWYIALWATFDADFTLKTALVSASTPSPPSPSITIEAPDGSTLFLPQGALTSEETLKFDTVTNDPALLSSRETAISRTFEINTSSSQAVSGNDFVHFSIKIDSTAVVDPEKILLKVQLQNGTVLPVDGTYNTATGIFSIPLAGVSNGWKLVAVQNEYAKRINPATLSVPTISPMGWQTSMDWQTCDWSAVNTSTIDEATILYNILPVVTDVCQTLEQAGFRSPKLWVNNTSEGMSRTVHIIEDGGSRFVGNWDEENPNFDLDSLNEEEMILLGRMYVDFNQLQNLNQIYGITLGNITAHEMLHAVQFGYDFRKDYYGIYKAYTEGTATPLGQTYQDNINNSITSGLAHVRSLRGKEYHLLFESVDEPGNHYSKQDFFTWITRRFANNNFNWLHTLFEEMGVKTKDFYDQDRNTYFLLFRQALDQALQSSFDEGLPETYRQYILDRAYFHSDDAILRPSLETTADFDKNKLARKLFTSPVVDNTVDVRRIVDLSPYAGETEKHYSYLLPLGTLATTIDLAFSKPLDPNGRVATLPIVVTLKDGYIADDKGEGIYIQAFLEDDNGIMLPEGTLMEDGFSLYDGGNMPIYVDGTPVRIPVPDQAGSLTLLVMNTFFEQKNVEVNISIGPFITRIAPQPANRGGQLTVEGFGFGNSNDNVLAYLGNQLLSIASRTSTSITLSIPTNAQTGSLKIIRNNIESNEVPLVVSIPTGNWEMEFEIFERGEDVIRCTETITRLYKQWAPVYVADDGSVSFNFNTTGYSGNGYFNVKGTGTFVNDVLNVGGSWTMNRVRSVNLDSGDDGYQFDDVGTFSDLGGRISYGIFISRTSNLVSSATTTYTRFRTGYDSATSTYYELPPETHVCSDQRPVVYIYNFRQR